MYTVYVDGTLIYNDMTPELETTKLINPKLSLDISAAGTFSATVMPGNAGYNKFNPLISTIEVYRDNEWIWSGRPLRVDEDFYYGKKIECEGALAFFNDIIVPMQSFPKMQTTALLREILNIYNEKVPESRKIYLGTVSSSTDAGTPISSYELVSDDDSVMKCLEGIIEHWGVYPKIRKASDKLYLDLLTASSFPLSSQTINFGHNLLDYTNSSDWSEVVTVIKPIGKDLDTHEITGNEDYPDKLTIESVNNKDPYLTNDSALASYGRVERVVEWTDVEDAETLKELGQLYLDELQYNDLMLTIKVADLHYLNASIEAFNLYTRINCISKPHNLNKTFLISKMDIPFDSPENTTFTFEKPISGKFGSTSKISSNSGPISGSLNSIPTLNEFRKTARANATNLINSATNGFVSLVPDATNHHTEYLAISDAETLDRSTSRWVWNKNGLMHQKRDSPDVPWEDANLAITMEGEIVADMLTTGVIRSGENWWNLDTGELHMQTASHTLPTGETIDWVALAQNGKEVADAADKRSQENAQKVADAAAKAQEAYDKQIGSANLLYDTKSMRSWVVAGEIVGDTSYTSDGSTLHVELTTDDIWKLYTYDGPTQDYNYYWFFGFTGVTPTWDVVMKSPSGKLRVEHVKGRRMTLSFYTDVWENYRDHPVNDNNSLFVCLCLCTRNGQRKCWRDVRVESFIDGDRSGPHDRVKISFTMDSDFFDKGSYQSSIDNLYFEVWIYPRVIDQTHFGRFKLEFGDEATDWDPKYVDLEEAAGNLADSAYEKSRTYTNEISEKDREFTKEQKAALDESFTQREVLKRMTNNFTIKLIRMENNELYINASYIRSGTLDAGVIRAGILTDGKHANLWNMATGYFQTKNAVMKNANVDGQFTTGTSNKIVLQDGMILGYQGTKRVGIIDSSSIVTDIDNGRQYKGWQVQGGILRINTRLIAVARSESIGTMTYNGFTGTVDYETVIDVSPRFNGNNLTLDITKQTHGIECINGIVVGAW